MFKEIKKVDSRIRFIALSLRVVVLSVIKCLMIITGDAWEI